MIKKIAAIVGVTLIVILVRHGLSQAINANTISAVSFNDQIIDYHSKFVDPFIEFTETDLTQLELAEIDAKLEDLKSLASDSLKATEQLQAPDGGEELKQAAVNLFKFYEETMMGDYRELVILSLKENLTDAEIKEGEKVSERLGDNGLKAEGDFTLAQEKFAEANNFELEFPE